MLLHPRLVELHDVGAGSKQIGNLGVDGGGIVHRHRFGVAVKVVLRLLAHRERARQRGLDRAVGVGAQYFEIAQLDGPGPPDRRHHPRHRDRLTGPVDRRPGIVGVDT